MTAPLRHRHTTVVALATDGAGRVKSPSDSPDAARTWFADLIWAAFPGRSENDVAERAAKVLGVTRRQVRNWLRGENDAKLRHVVAVMAIAGVELTLDQRGAR